MSRQQIMDLRPGTNYQIQVRSVADDAVSEWSRVFNFTTMVDTVLPKTPQNATWVVSGDSFHGEWDVVTQNTSAETINVDHYDVELVNGGTTRIVTVAQGSARMSYDLSFEANRALFTTPKAAITMRVRAVDSKGLSGDWTLPITATNAAPAPVTGLTANAVTDSVYLKWTAPADTDLAGYNLYVGTSPGPTNKINNKPITSTEYNYQTTTYTLQYFKVTAVDKFGAESTPVEVSATPVSPFAQDTTAPSTPTALAATITNNANGIGASAAVSWTMSSPPSDLAGFWIRYRKVGDTFYTNLTFQSADRAGTVVLPAAYTNYEFQIKAFDWSNNESAWSSTVTATSPAAGTPTTISALTITAIPAGLRFSWSAVPETNIKYYEVQIATNSGMSTGVQTFNTGQSLFLNVNGLAQNTQYWAQVRAVNQGGTAGAWGPVAPATATTQRYQDVITVTADVIQPGTLGAGIINIGAGATLQTNGGAIKSNTFNGTFSGGVYQNDATAGYYIDSTNGIVVKTGKISADSIVAGTISGTNSIVLSGANAKIVGGSWELSGNGLVIPDGGIQAAKLLIQNGQNIMPAIYSDFEGTSAYYKNISGNIAILQGGIIVGTNPSFKVGSQSFGTIWGTNTSNPIIAFAKSATDYNIPVEGGKTYIFSLYTWCQGSVPTNVQMKVKWGDGTMATLSTGAGYATSANLPSGMPFDASTAVRLSGYATVPAGVTGAQIQIESSTLTSGAGYNIDGIMVEEKVSSAYAPSSWKPGTSTIIVGDQIKTGQIISSNTGQLTAVTPVYDNSGAQVGTQRVVIDDPASAPAWSIDTQGDARFSNLNVTGNAVVGPSTAVGTSPVDVTITTTSGSASVTTQTGMIVPDDIGQAITATGVPASTTVKYVIQGCQYAIGGSYDLPYFPWNNSGQPSRYVVDNAQLHSGSQSLKAVAGTSTSIPLTVGPIAVSTGDVISISYWVYRDSTYNGTNANAKLRMGDQSSAIISAGTTFYDAASTAANTWVQKTVSYTVTAGVTALNMTLSIDHTAGTIWFDDFSIINTTKAAATVGTTEVVLSANATASGTVSGSLSRAITYTSSISSSNYIPNSTGWTIRSDGFAEFQTMAANSITIDALGAGNYNKEIELVDDGRIIAKGQGGWVSMDSTGFYSRGFDVGQDPTSDEPIVPFIEFPNTGAPNIVSGKLISEELIVKGNSSGVGATFNTSNYLNQGASLIINNSIAAPSAPLIVKSWPNYPVTMVSGRTYSGLAYSTNATHAGQSAMIRVEPQVTTTTTDSYGTNTFKKRKVYISLHNTSGTNTANYLLGDYTDYQDLSTWPAETYTRTWVGIARIGNIYALLYREAISGGSTQADQLWVRTIDVTNLANTTYGYASVGGTGSGALTSGKSNFSIAPDLVNNRFLVSWRDSAGNYVMTYFAASATSYSGLTAFRTMPAANAGSTAMSLVGYGAFDFGINRIIYRDDTNKRVLVYDDAASPARQTAYDWPFADGITGTVAWDPSSARFKQVYPTTWRIYEYANNGGTTGTTFNSGSLTQTWVFKSTLYDSNGDGSAGSFYETAASSGTSITVSNRCQLTVTLPEAIPYSSVLVASPDKARIWVSKNSGSYGLAATINQPAKTYVLYGGTQPNSTPLVAPTSTTKFPDGSSAIIQSAVSGVTLRGDGTWALGTLTSENTGVTTNSATTTNLKIGGVRIVAGSFATTGSGTAWWGTINFPTAAFSQPPHVIISSEYNGTTRTTAGMGWVNSYNPTTTNFGYQAVWNLGDNHSGMLTASWIAIGPA